MSYRVYQYFLFEKEYDGDMFFISDKNEECGFACYADQGHTYKIDVRIANTFIQQQTNTRKRTNFPEIQEEPPENFNNIAPNKNNKIQPDNFNSHNNLYGLTHILCPIIIGIKVFFI